MEVTYCVDLMRAQYILSWGYPLCVPSSVQLTRVTHVRLGVILVLTLNIPWLWPHALGMSWYIVSSAAVSSPDVVRPLCTHHAIIMLSAVSPGHCGLCPRWHRGWRGQGRVREWHGEWHGAWLWPVFASRYYSINSAGASTLTFNATSIQNGVLLGFLVLVLGALILPLFGVNLLASDEVTWARHLLIKKKSVKPCW